MKRLYIIVLIIISLMITACDETNLKDDPDINVQFKVSDLSDKDFESVGTQGLVNPTRNDFKNVEFTLDVTHSKKVSNRKIIIPDLKKAVDSFDKDRYWNGQSYHQDNENENYAKYGYTFVLYSKGLDDQDIKDIFKTAEVKVIWTTEDGDKKEKVVNLYDIVQFK